MSNRYDPTAVRPGQVIYDDEGNSHVVDYALGNYIFCTDGYVYIDFEDREE